MDIVHLQINEAPLAGNGDHEQQNCPRDETGGKASSEQWVSADYVMWVADYHLQRDKISVASTTMMAPEVVTEAVAHKHLDAVTAKVPPQVGDPEGYDMHTCVHSGYLHQDSRVSFEE